MDSRLGQVPPLVGDLEDGAEPQRLHIHWNQTVRKNHGEAAGRIKMARCQVARLVQTLRSHIVPSRGTNAQHPVAVPLEVH